MIEKDPCDCESFRQRIEALLDHQLDRAEAELLLAHACECPTCSTQSEAEVHLREQIRCCLQGAAPSVPAALRVKIMVAIHRETLVRLRPIRPTERPNSG